MNVPWPSASLTATAGVVDLIEFFEVEKGEDFVDLEESAKPTRISEEPRISTEISTAAFAKRLGTFWRIAGS
jgi:hypothetical protein